MYLLTHPSVCNSLDSNFCIGLLLGRQLDFGTLFGGLFMHALDMNLYFAARWLQSGASQAVT